MSDRFEQNFTLGEWRVEDYREDDGWNDCDYAVVEQNNGYLVARIENCSLEEQEANAHLIAAAPDMYWMLEDVKDELKQMQYNPNISQEVKASTWLLLQHINRVQKKARGEA